MLQMATAGRMYCVHRNTSPVKSEDIDLSRITALSNNNNIMNDNDKKNKFLISPTR